MPQASVWEKEYNKQKLLSPSDIPQKNTLKFFKYIRKKHDLHLENKPFILDIGAGNGRNANYLASRGAIVSGIEISATAVRMAKTAAKKLNVEVDYHLGSFGETFPFADDTFDVAIDITSSNSLDEKERKIYLKELHRTLKPNGLLCVKTLCLDGDKHAKNMIKLSPGPEKNTYIMKEIGLVERVFSEQDMRDIYTPYFDIISLTKKESYTRMNNRSYKRIFWIAYLKHKL